MRVGQRLFLAVVPAIVGLLSVAALVYFGEYARQAPEWLVVLAVAAALGSAVLAWRNTRYVAQRIEQLAARRGESEASSGAVRRATQLLGAALHPQPSAGGDADELDRIETLVERLSDALAQERETQAARAEALVRREREYASLVEHAVAGALEQLEEVRLPLHILLENRFGELNENQEEMLGAARGAAEAADAALLRLRDVVRLDTGSLRLRAERVRLQDVVEGLLPPLRVAAGERDVAVHADLPPTLPALVADRGRLQEAISALLFAVVRQAPPGATIAIGGSHDRQDVQLTVTGGGALALTDASTLAERLIRAHGGRIDLPPGRLVLHLPIGGTAGVP
ncbi:MAG: hypothetical protein AMXMBFR55_23950 [Gemmatimonadota bacterium]